MQKIAIFGGTFNPIHLGHLAIATTALQQNALDQVLWVPSQPHHKPHDAQYKTHKIPDFTHRREMIRRAIELSSATPQFALTELPEQNYAIDTLLTLQAQIPDAKWFWIVGVDAFRLLPRWYRSVELVDRCSWLVAPRGDQVVNIADFTPQSPKPDWEPLKMTPIDISSSLVRQRCHDRGAIGHLVPPSVERYIVQHGLYSAPT
jgi:nicotinate-nucleotide adenylyltransferase